jgi:3-oxoacyl-[acyl-carrier-protein] synthase II
VNDAAWVTGIGMVSPLGVGSRATWQGLCEGRSAIAPVRGFDAGRIASRIAGEVPADFEAAFKARCRLPFPKRYSRFTQLALYAGKEALDASGLDLADEDTSRIGVALGVGAGSFHYLYPIDEALAGKGEGLWPALDHNYIVKHMTNAATAQLSIWLGLQGPSTTVSSACASGAQAIATAADWIRTGRVDVVLTGGTDATVNPFVMHAYCQVGALSTRNDDATHASSPFDRARDGFVMAEGAAVLVLESASHASRRGAPRLATLAGYGLSSDAFKITTPRPGSECMARSMRLALADAGVAPDRVGYISAHGTSTPQNDASETLAIREVFGAKADAIPVSSQKSMIGHAIGAASAISAAVSAMTIHESVVTPTINLRDPDPACDLDYVPNVARRAKIDYAMANAFGFGGHNCCLVFAG